jgi:hypothetical protein
MFATRLALVLLLGAAPPSALGTARLSLEQAESLGRKLLAIQHGAAARPRPPAPLTVTEDELNSYVAYKLRAQMPPSVSDVRVRFERDRLLGSALIDFDQLKGKLPPFGPLNPLSLLSGRVPTEFRGRLPNEDGFGTLELEELSLGSLPVPIALVEQAVARSTRTAERPDGFDLHAPFRLPYGIRRVRLQPGRAVLEY